MWKIAVLSLGLVAMMGCNSAQKKEYAAKSVDDLVKLLKDKDPDVRVAACRGLSEKGKEAAGASVELQRVAQEDTNKDVRKAAQKAYERLAFHIDRDTHNLNH